MATAKEHSLTDEQRFKASVAQVYTYGNSQYTRWRIAALKSIQKILLNLDDFYSELLPELSISEENMNQDIVHEQIRNGWFYEAVSQAEQAIEDLFSTLMNTGDIAYFAKNVITYKATAVKKYIWDFKVDDLSYIADQFHLPYFDLDEPWENEEVFAMYSSSMLLIQSIVKALQKFHKKYYLDYCQYKHGLSVGLGSIQLPLMVGDTERLNKMMEKPLENSLCTFHNETIEEYKKRTGELPAMGILLKPDLSTHVRALHDEKNLLYFTIHHADIEEMIRVAKQACILLEVVWNNILNRCTKTVSSDYEEIAFPVDQLGRYIVIGFPKV